MKAELIVFLIIILVISALHLPFLKYDIQTINQKISAINLKKPLFIGNWSPSISWGTEARTLPLFPNSAYSKTISENILPDLIVVEVAELSEWPNEIRQQLLEKISSSDSITFEKIDQWKLILIWSPNQQTSKKQ